MMSSSTEATPFYTNRYRNRLSLGNRCARIAWAVVSLLMFRFTPTPLFGWRRFILRCFGSKLAPTAVVYPSAVIWAPWNLSMADHACLGRNVDCYCVAPVYIGADVTVSMRTFLCTASHDVHHPDRPLVTGPIRLERGAFVFAEAFVGMNVTVGEGAVVAARAVVVKDVAANTIVGGNPARVIGMRKISGLGPATGSE